MKHNTERVSMEKATARPWEGNLKRDENLLIADGSNPFYSGIVADLRTWQTPLEEYSWQKRGDYIVRAVNSHDALVSALERAIDIIEAEQDNEGYPKVPNHFQEALRLAKGA